MERIPVESKTGMCSYGYDPATYTLEIEFKARKEGEPNKVYHYLNVSEEEFNRFNTAKSKGSHFLKVIKPRFECKKLEPEGKASEEKDKAQAASEDKAS
jgi:KTSC domain